MSSKTGSEKRWSLTGRMTLIFAATTSALLALDAAWSAHFMYSTKLDAIRAFLEHETQEFAHDIGETDGSLAEVREMAQVIADVSEEPPCAFRIHDEGGRLIAESGDERLLALGELGPPGWRDTLFGSQAARGTIVDGVHGLQLEVLADASSYVAAFFDYMISAAIALLVSVVLAALAGWYGANRGLRGLREVVRRAGDVDFTSGGTTLALDGAPQEVRDVGAALEGMIQRIDGGLDSMRTFTAGLAHELRSPLQSLIGRTEIALMATRSPESYEETLRGNLDDLHALSDSIDNMVAICRSASPNRQVQPSQHFDLAAESRLRLERERQSAERSGVTVGIHGEGDTRLTADREACLRVVRNLVSNAIQWTPAGGTVDVTFRGRVDHVEIDVVDEGPGVPDEMAEKLYTAFVSGMPRVGRRSGYGLGLAICKSVADEHGGTIRFENRPGGGARFVVTLPKSPRVETASPQEAPVGVRLAGGVL